MTLREIDDELTYSILRLFLRSSIKKHITQESNVDDDVVQKLLIDRPSDFFSERLVNTE